MLAEGNPIWDGVPYSIDMGCTYEDEDIVLVDLAGVLEERFWQPHWLREPEHLNAATFRVPRDSSLSGMWTFRRGWHARIRPRE